MWICLFKCLTFLGLWFTHDCFLHDLIFIDSKTVCLSSWAKTNGELIQFPPLVHTNDITLNFCLQDRWCMLFLIRHHNRLCVCVCVCVRVHVSRVRPGYCPCISDRWLNSPAGHSYWESDVLHQKKDTDKKVRQQFTSLS